MDETIISINGPNILTLALMIFGILAVVYVVTGSAVKIRGDK
jgi:hypothetical protein